MLFEHVHGLKNAWITHDCLEEFGVLVFSGVFVSIIVHVIYLSVPTYSEVNLLLGWVPGSIKCCPVAVSWNSVTLIPDKDIS